MWNQITHTTICFMLTIGLVIGGCTAKKPSSTVDPDTGLDAVQAQYVLISASLANSACIAIKETVLKDAEERAVVAEAIDIVRSTIVGQPADIQQRLAKLISDPKVNPYVPLIANGVALAGFFIDQDRLTASFYFYIANAAVVACNAVLKTGTPVL